MPLLIASANSSSERRITPGWSIAHFKTRLEPITGIPASAQRLSLRIGSQDPVALEAADEQSTQLASFPLQAYAEIYVSVSSVLGTSASTFVFVLRPQTKRRMEACHMCCAMELQSHIHAASWLALVIGSLNSRYFLFTALARSGNQSRDSLQLLHDHLCQVSASLLFRNNKAFVSSRRQPVANSNPQEHYASAACCHPLCISVSALALTPFRRHGSRPPLSDHLLLLQI